MCNHALYVTRTLHCALRQLLFEHNDTNKTKRRARVRCRRTRVSNKNSQRATEIYRMLPPVNGCRRRTLLQVSRSSLFRRMSLCAPAGTITTGFDEKGQFHWYKKQSSDDDEYDDNRIEQVKMS